MKNIIQKLCNNFEIPRNGVWYAIETRLVLKNSKKKKMSTSVAGK